MRNRRSVLLSIGTGAGIVLTGCTGSLHDDNGGGSQSTTTASAKSEGRKLTDIIGISSHEWRGPSLLQVTVENKMEGTIDLVQVEANLYVENTRIGHSYTNISSLAGDTSVSSEIRFNDGFDQNPCNATRYDLYPNFYYDSQQFGQRMEYEFNPNFCE